MWPVGVLNVGAAVGLCVVGDTLVGDTLVGERLVGASVGVRVAVGAKDGGGSQKAGLHPMSVKGTPCSDTVELR